MTLMMNYCLVLSYFRIILTITTCYHQNALHLLKNNLSFNQTLCLTWTRKHSGMWRRCLNMSNLCHNVNLGAALKANKTGRWLLVFVNPIHIWALLRLIFNTFQNRAFRIFTIIITIIIIMLCNLKPILCASTGFFVLFYFLVAENRKLHFAFVKQ